MSGSITLSDIIAGIALLLSLYSMYKTGRLNKLQEDILKLEHELNSIQLEKEKEELANANKAELGASKYSIGTGKMRLKVFNKGKVKAYHVRVEYSEDIKQHILDDIFPMEYLDPLQSVEVGVMVFGHFPSKSKVNLIWKDENGSEFTKEVLIAW